MSKGIKIICDFCFVFVCISAAIVMGVLAVELLWYFVINTPLGF